MLAIDVRSCRRRSPARRPDSSWPLRYRYCVSQAVLKSSRGFMVPRSPLNLEAVMRLGTIGILLLAAVAFATSAPAQKTPAASAITRSVVAAAKLPSVIDGPLYFRAVSVTFPAGEKSAALAADEILYQISGSTEVIHLRWRHQNAERRRGTVHGSRGDGDIEGWERRGHRHSSTSSSLRPQTSTGPPKRHRPS